MIKTHTYSLTVAWTGNLGKGTIDYRAYSRNHDIQIDGKPVIHCSSDPSFRGDPARHNPEELLVASLSSCHMLWYLHLCANAGIVVTDYVAHAVGVMEEDSDGSGRFTSVTLKPCVTITRITDIKMAKSLHDEAHRMCFIANSMNFPVQHEAETITTST